MVHLVSINAPFGSRSGNMRPPMLAKQWSTPGGVLFVVPSGREPTGERYPFAASLLEGPRGLRHGDMVALATAAGAPPGVISAGPHAIRRFVRSALDRGAVVALRQPPMPAAPSVPRVRVEGTFSEEQRSAPDRRHPKGWDAETEYMVVWRYQWTLDRGGGRSRVALTIVFTLQSTVTTYYGSATPGSPHEVQRTLGAHERAHAELARTWWTEERLAAIATEERMAFDLVLPRGLSKPHIESRCAKQTDAIGTFVRELHQREQESRLDRMQGARPRFVGTRY